MSITVYISEHGSLVQSGVQHSIHVSGEYQQSQYIMNSLLLFIMSANTNCHM